MTDNTSSITDNTIEQSGLNQDEDIVSSENIEEPLRRSVRQRRIPNFLKDYHHQIMNNTSNDILYPIFVSLAYDRFSTKQLCFTLAISSHNEPHTYEEAIKSTEWCEAM